MMKIGYIQEYDLELNPHLTERFKFREAPFTRRISSRGDRVYSKMLQFPVDYEDIVDNANIIKKVYFPREILPISVVASEGVNFLIATIDETKKGTKYYETNNTRYILEKNKLNGSLCYDKVIIDTNTNEVVKVLVRNMPNVVCEVRMTPEGFKYLYPCITSI